MKIAIIGSGISGLTAAYFLNKRHEVTLFEANDCIGGHTNTYAVHTKDAHLNIDTGFIVFNKKTYPNFTWLLEKLQVPIQKTSMSFSVKNQMKHLEYSATSLNSLFSQRKNLLNISFMHMLLEIKKFNQAAKRNATHEISDITLSEFISDLNLSDYAIENYVLPMTRAIWSSDFSDALQMPAKFLCAFFDNHGMLDLYNRPDWYSIIDGSKNYIDKLVKTLRIQPRIGTPVLSVERFPENIVIHTRNSVESFDKVVIATHSDQALKILKKASPEELSILNAIPYQKNDVCLHTDTTLLPTKKMAWASWNYQVNSDAKKCTLTYNMNILQKLQSEKTYCVSLNQNHTINPCKIIKKFCYSHPVFTTAGILAQKKIKLINGYNNTLFCGAYWKNGFHEDGMVSGIKVVEELDKELICETPYIKAL